MKDDDTYLLISLSHNYCLFAIIVMTASVDVLLSKNQALHMVNIAD